MSLCRGCNATISWARVAGSAKSIPLYGPVDEGTWVWTTGLIARPMTDVEFADEDFKYNQRWLPHWANCPNADEFRKASIPTAPKPIQGGLFDDQPADGLTTEW